MNIVLYDVLQYRGSARCAGPWRAGSARRARARRWRRARSATRAAASRTPRARTTRYVTVSHAAAGGKRSRLATEITHCERSQQRKIRSTKGNGRCAQQTLLTIEEPPQHTLLWKPSTNILSKRSRLYLRPHTTHH